MFPQVERPEQRRYHVEQMLNELVGSIIDAVAATLAVQPDAVAEPLFSLRRACS